MNYCSVDRAVSQKSSPLIKELDHFNGTTNFQKLLQSKNPQNL